MSHFVQAEFLLHVFFTAGDRPELASHCRLLRPLGRPATDSFLKWLAGRFEFLQYFPDSTQGVALAPLGSRGCLVAAVDAVRGFSRLDQVRVH